VGISGSFLPEIPMSPPNKISTRFKVRPSNERAKLITELSCLLWDETKPKGEEAVPEAEWETVLAGPCNGDQQLIAEVCAHERSLRPPKLIQLDFRIAPDNYQDFLIPFFTVKDQALDLLWDGKDWHPEDAWDKLLSEWVPPHSYSKERLKEIARWLKKVPESGRFIMRLRVAEFFNR
jgi:hypothetical protein